MTLNFNVRGEERKRLVKVIGDALETKPKYMGAPTFANHLIEICEALLALEETDITAIMDFPDDLKLCSSMTLFTIAEPENEVFRKILGKYFNGELDKKTIELLK